MLVQPPPANPLRKAGFPLPQAEGPNGKHEMRSFTGFSGVNQDELKKLLELSFGKALVPGYFELPAETVIMDGGNLGVAIVKTAFGEKYLDKFAVHPDHRGNGIARELWGALRDRHDSLIWRSREDNPINCWYRRNSDIEEHSGKWTVFSYGMAPERFRALVPLVASIPETFMK